MAKPKKSPIGAETDGVACEIRDVKINGDILPDINRTWTLTVDGCDQTPLERAIETAREFYAKHLPILNPEANDAPWLFSARPRFFGGYDIKLSAYHLRVTRNFKVKWVR